MFDLYFAHPSILLLRNKRSSTVYFVIMQSFFFHPCTAKPLDRNWVIRRAAAEFHFRRREQLYTTLHYTTLHYTTLHYTTLYYTILYYTILYYTYTTTAFLSADCTVVALLFVILYAHGQHTFSAYCAATSCIVKGAATFAREGTTHLYEPSKPHFIQIVFKCAVYSVRLCWTIWSCNNYLLQKFYWMRTLSTLSFKLPTIANEETKLSSQLLILRICEITITKAIPTPAIV